jgi:hypothetical protein
VFDRALKLRPDSAATLNNVGNILHGQGRISEAAEVYRRALRIKPDYGLVHWNLGLMLLLQGELEQGWTEYEWRLQVKQFGPRTVFNRPQWDGGDLDGQRIVFHAEQGFGDVIQFARYLPEIARRGGRIVLACHTEMHRLMRSAGRTRGEVGSLVEDWVMPDAMLPAYDTHCPMMSLPKAMGTTLANIPLEMIPYIWTEPALQEQWRKRLEGVRDLKVGVAWAGRSTHPNDRNRSFALQTLAPLAGVKGVRLFSLQKGEPARQTKEAGFEITDWTEELEDFADTAAMVEQLDMVISADTSVVHLAAAMGKPTWVLLPFVPDWRWMMDREDSPWYPSMRLFRQPKIGDWQTPIARVVEALKSR